MTQPPPNPGLSHRERSRLWLLTGLAALALVWERLWPRVLPVLGAVSLFVSVALLDVLPMLPFWLHGLVLLVFAGALAWTLKYLWQGHYSASHIEARHRIERDSRVDHRPLTALVDQPLHEDLDATKQALWWAHLARMRGMLAGLRVGTPSPAMARRDPWGLRAVVPLLLLIGFAAGGSEAGARLERALMPKPGSLTGEALTLDIWITPPAYTGVAPILLQRQAPQALQAAQAAQAPQALQAPQAPQAQAPEAVAVPVGSTVLAQLGHADGRARLMIGERAIDFDVLDGEQAGAGRRVEAEIGDDDLGAGQLDIRLGEDKVAAWPMRVVPDRAPEVELTAPPKNRGKGILALQYEARDDYALAALRLQVRHSQGWPLPGSDEVAAEQALALPNPGATAGKGRAARDFSAHPWAGEVVELRLVAVDAAGQKGETDAVSLTLPEREFSHPVARRIIAARKKLNQPGEAVISDVISRLQSIAERPQHFYDDTVVFLALSVAQSRLGLDENPDMRPDVQRILWQTALRLEDGEFAIAERDLRDIQDRLTEALRKGADDREIERLMDQLQRAMDKYMQALAEHLRKNDMTAEQMNPMTSQMMESTDLQQMLDKARQLSQAGARDAAKRMLQQLNQMLNALRNGARMARPQAGQNQGRKALNKLRELSRRQQQLLDKTFRQQQQGQQGRQGQKGQQGQRGQQGRPNATQRLAPGQSQLRRDLGRMMLQMDEMLGAIPPSMGRAERAMKGAAEALGKGNAARAARDQAEALSQLRQATESMAEQMARQRQPGSMGLGMGRPQNPMRQRGRDPFGRRTGQGANGESETDGIKVPTQRELLRSREIMQELRRRSGEQFRPRLEREYIDRLIKRF
jgi:uncharacterized protein (TIGR02302 family)